MASDDQSKRSLADDPGFIASLSDLDRGIIDEAPRTDQRPAPVTRAPSAPPARSARPALVAPAPAPASSRAPRRLIDLFPASATMDVPATDAASDPVLAGVVPAAAAPPRRAIPLVDVPPPFVSEVQRPAASARDEGLTYETFYGLHERAFSLTVDPRFLYHSTAHDRAAQAVLDAIRRRDGIAVLTGELGVGKTMLCRAIMEQLDRRTLISLVADSFVTPEDLLKTVLVDFGVISASDVAAGRLATASRADLKTALRDFVYSLAPLQAFAVIIIDEAQNLSVDLLNEVRALVDAGGDEQLLQLILVGQPSLSATLSKPDLRPAFQRVTTRATLESLAADELAGYVSHRLQVAGASPRVEFSDRAIERLGELSRGVPRVINLLCHRALAAGSAESASTIDERLIEHAAEELDLAGPAAPTSRIRTIARAAVFALLVLIGAAAGAYVFRANVAAWLEQRQARPSAPVQPQPVVPPPATPASNP